MKDFLIAASRGRNPTNPSDRTAGIPTEQRLEINKDGICNTLTTVLKDNYVIEIYVEEINNIDIITYDIPRLVKVRKFDVNVDKLKVVLKNHKNRVKMSNKMIADYLNLPITKVAHWFRSDKGFSIPDPEHWLRLKALLSITTNEFDLSILTFEERLGIYDEDNRVYGINGLSPTITTVAEKIRILVEEVDNENIRSSDRND